MTTALAVERAQLLELHARKPDRYPALLESAAFHPRIGRRSLLFAFPGMPLVAEAGRDFFDDLDAAHRLSSAGSSGFGHLVYLGYELLTQVEAVVAPPSTGPLPDAFAVPIAACVVFDHATGAAEIRGDEAAAELVAADLASICPTATGTTPADTTPADTTPADTTPECSTPSAARRVKSDVSIEEEDPERFLAAVRRAQEYIAAGDIFQANLSREWRARVGADLDAIALYTALRAANPAPFAGVVRWGDAAIVSSSPERLLRSDGTYLESRPIAGTRPRIGVDSGAIAGLLGSEKERAEHIMLVDLIRNDLGKVARYGSVEVDELMTVESYEHVHHIVSDVRCEPIAGCTPGAALRAVFPGGTITGCPKVRCMEIIAELEGTGRGAYTGSIGYIERDGAFDFNILIRTLVWEPGRVTFRAGAGIVSDSDPLAELDETRAKARGLLRALGAA